MKKEQLKELMERLSLEEKIGQLVQLSGDFYTKDEALKVGPQQKLGISDEVVRLSGSVLNVTGAKKVREIQERYLKESRHKIPLLLWLMWSTDTEPFIPFLLDSELPGIRRW